jgi:hypothetical protein
MKKNTIDDYEKAIKAKYAEVNTAEHDVYLLNPTPAGLKNLCIALLDDLTPSDKKAYRNFFSLKEEGDVRKQIEMFDTNKFKTLCLFLKGNTKTTSADKLELLAVLLNFESRPYTKFRLGESTVVVVDNTIENKNAINPEQSDIEQESSPEEKTVNDNVKDPVYAVQNFANSLPVKGKHNDAYKINYLQWVLVALALCIIGLTFKESLFKEEECMLWKNDHYELVPCTTQTNSFISNAVIPADKETVAYQKKINPCDTTTFFLPDGKPCVWYCKMRDGSIEYFSYHGLHPVTGVTLKKITPYMINKYVVAQNKQQQLKP